ncbi:MAG: response regulator, partial [Actinomycetota bacterium]
MERYRAMLVDDVPELRRLLRHVLEWSDRFEVVGEADNGKHAIELAQQLRPDLVLLDISMPVMDGMEALPQIVRNSPSSKVVMLSGFEAERLGQAALDMGAAGYIEKGTAPAQLMSRLLAILDGGGGGIEEAPVFVPPSRPEEVKPHGAVLEDFSQEEMMSLVAHEIRNPLAVIQGFGMELMNRWDVMPEHIRR